MRRRGLLVLPVLALPFAALAQLRDPGRVEQRRAGVRERVKTRREHIAEFRSGLRAFLADRPMLEFARGFREYQYRSARITGLQAGLALPGKFIRHAAETTPAAGSVVQEAADLISGFEIGSAATYTQLYQAPLWPGGNSGVTIGIGFDLGYCDQAAFTRSWGAVLPAASLGTLAPACTVRADKAQSLLASQAVLKTQRVTWDQALAQFTGFLPQIVDETAAAFPNTDGLPAESMGALVSLVFNRGGDTSASKPSRAEMANIKQLMAAKNYAAVPEQIIAMKRLWPTVPGLLARRDLEAQLFSAGLAPES